MRGPGQAKQPDLAGADGGGRHCEEEAVPGTLTPSRAADPGILPKPAGELQRGVRVCGADPRAGL